MNTTNHGGALVRLHIIDADGTESACTLAEFIAANASDQESCDLVRDLAPGERVMLGGGASPEVVVVAAEAVTRGMLLLWAEVQGSVDGEAGCGGGEPLAALVDAVCTGSGYADPDAVSASLKRCHRVRGMMTAMYTAAYRRAMLG